MNQTLAFPSSASQLTFPAASNSPVERARRIVSELTITIETPRSGRNGLLDVRPRHGSKLVSLPLCEHSIIPKQWLVLTASFRVKLFASRLLSSMPACSTASNAPVERARRTASEPTITIETPRSGQNGLLDVRPPYGSKLSSLQMCGHSILPQH